MGIKIVVATHKKYWMPSDSCYFPVWGGASLGKGQITPDFARDDEGENISGKNPNFCELTVLYWAWKNINEEYLGLVHYRRYFASKRLGNKKDRVASEADLKQRLDKYPVILPCKRHYWIETGYSQYIHAHHAVDLAETRRIIERRYPQYLPAYDASMKRVSGHRFNMLVMRSNLLQAYCTWLFSVLFELEGCLDISGYSDYDRRVFGFVGERLLDCWIETNHVAYSEMPVVNMESQHWLHKGFAFVQRKFNAKSGHMRET